jgi:REP element-mobilizing transposase RayT
MPRKARIDTAGALQHIIFRGIKRRKIFYGDKDRDAFVDRLGEVLTQTHTEFHNPPPVNPSSAGSGQLVRQKELKIAE